MKLRAVVIGESPYPDDSQVLRYEDGTSIAFAVNERASSIPSSFRNLDKLHQMTFGVPIEDRSFSRWISQGFLFLNWSDNRDYIEILWQIPDLPVWCMSAKVAKHYDQNGIFFHTPHPSGANPRFHKWMKEITIGESPFVRLPFNVYQK